MYIPYEKSEIEDLREELRSMDKLEKTLNANSESYISVYPQTRNKIKDYFSSRKITRECLDGRLQGYQGGGSVSRQ